MFPRERFLLNARFFITHVNGVAFLVVIKHQLSLPDASGATPHRPTLSNSKHGNSNHLRLILTPHLYTRSPRSHTRTVESCLWE
jgi:hypothetical protein